MTKAGKATAQGRFLIMDSMRQEVIRRAERAAQVTIPSVFPRQPHTENSRLPTPYQSAGAQAVNNLAAKMTLALFPPNSAFFRLSLDEEVEEVLRARRVNIEKVKEKLARIERVVVQRMERERLRPILSLASKHLLVTGNGMIDVGKDSTRFFPLHSFVVERDNSGNVVEAVIKEQIHPELLPEETLQVCKVDPVDKRYTNGVDVYTRVVLDDRKYRYWQEINGVEVPGSKGDYRKESPRFIFLRWTSVHGENYGRGLVDEYIGDFNALEGLSRDLLKASAAAAKVIFLARPGSMVRPKDLAQAESGDCLFGNEGDVSTIQLDKFADFRITLERVRDIQDSIARAFLMNSSIQRQAERVTAEEIRTMAQELEDALGGVYSLLSNELQAPLVRRWLSLLNKSGKIPELPEEDVNLVITTGLDALGRGHELNKLMGALRALNELFGPEQVAMRLGFDAVASRVFTGFGVDHKDLVKSDEQLRMEQAQGLAAGIAQDAVPGMLQNAMKAQPNG